MPDEKVFEFRAEDHGVDQTIDKVRKNTRGLAEDTNKLKEIYSDMGGEMDRIMARARDLGKSGSDFGRTIDRDIKSYGESGRTRYDEALEVAKEGRRVGLAGAKNTMERGAVESSYEKKVTSAREEYETQKLQTRYLREIAEGIKSSTTDSATSETIRKARGADLGRMDPEQAYRTSILQGMPGQGGGMGGLLGGLKGLLGPMLGAGAGMWAINNLAGSYKDLTTAPSGEAYNRRQIERWLPFFGDLITAGDEKYYGIRSTREASLSRMYGVSGYQVGSYSGEFGRGGIPKGVQYGNYGPVGNYGLKIPEIAELQLGMMQSRGSSVSDHQASRMAIFNKAYGLDPSSLTNLFGMSRYGGVGQMNNMMGYLSAYYGNNPALMQHTLNSVTSLSQMSLAKYGQADMGRWAGVVTGMGSVGGQFQGQAGLQRIQSIQGGLTGGDEYSNALQLQILSRMNPGASWTDIKAMQEKGLGTKGYFSGMMKFAMQNYDEQGQIAFAQKQLGLGWNDSKLLLSRLKDDPELFERIEGVGAKNYLSQEGFIKGRATTGSGYIEKMESMVINAWTKSVADGMAEVARQAKSEVMFGGNANGEPVPIEMSDEDRQIFKDIEKNTGNVHKRRDPYNFKPPYADDE